MVRKTGFQLLYRRVEVVLCSHLCPISGSSYLFLVLILYPRSGADDKGDAAKFTADVQKVQLADNVTSYEARVLILNNSCDNVLVVHIRERVSSGPC